MKTCPYCGTQSDDSQKFCVHCGAPFVLEQQNNQAQPYQQNQANIQTPKATLLSSPAVKVALIIAFLIIAGFVGYLGINKNSSTSNSVNNTSQNSINEQPSDNTNTALPTEDSNSENSVYEGDNRSDHEPTIDVAVNRSNAKLVLRKWQNEQWTTVFSALGFAGKHGITGDKREGDGKTPTGTFKLGFVFGLTEPETGLDFRFVTPETEWVDDINSNYYNTWQDNDANKDWNSSEKLYQPFASGKAYEYIVIEYNGNGLGTGDQVTNGAGSAIFICGKNGKLGPSRGDIYISRKDMKNLLSNLDSSTAYINIHGE